MRKPLQPTVIFSEVREPEPKNKGSHRSKNRKRKQVYYWACFFRTLPPIHPSFLNTSTVFTPETGSCNRSHVGSKFMILSQSPSSQILTVLDLWAYSTMLSCFSSPLLAYRLLSRVGTAPDKEKRYLKNLIL